MKRLLLIPLLLLIAASCEEENSVNDPGGDNGTLTFLISYYDGSGGEPEGLHEFVYSNGTMTHNGMVSDVYPKSHYLASVDSKNGMLAFISNESKVMYGSTEDYLFYEVEEVPASEEYYYRHDKYSRPQIMSDGRIVYHIIHDDDGWDDWEEGQFAIYNPATGQTDLSGGLTDFITAQPEAGWDTEVGGTRGEFCLSPDERYIYFTAYGWGVDGGSIHTDYYMLMRYDIETRKYTRIAETDAVVMSTSDDGRYLFTKEYPHLAVYDVSALSGTGNVTPVIFDEIEASNVGTGQTKGDAVLFTRRGVEGYVSMYSVSGGYKVLSTPELLKPRDYRGLGYGAQFGPDGMVYFTASRDINTNDEIGFDVMKINPSNPAEPDSLFRVGSGYQISLFLIKK
jgi:hypothetical protein